MFLLNIHCIPKRQASHLRPAVTRDMDLHEHWSVWNIAILLVSIKPPHDLHLYTRNMSQYFRVVADSIRNLQLLSEIRGDFHGKETASAQQTEYAGAVGRTSQCLQKQ